MKRLPGLSRKKCMPNAQKKETPKGALARTVWIGTILLREGQRAEAEAKKDAKNAKYNSVPCDEPNHCGGASDRIPQKQDANMIDARPIRMRNHSPLISCRSFTAITISDAPIISAQAAI